MASRRYDPLKVQGLQRVMIEGSFAPNGTGSPSVTQGKGYTIARTSLGTYTVSMTDKFMAIDQVLVTPGSNDAQSYDVSVGAVSQSGQTAVIRTFRRGLGHIPLDLATARIMTSNTIDNKAAAGGVACSDSAPTLLSINAGTDNALVLSWAASNVAKLAWSFALPSDLDTTTPSSMVFNFLAKMAGATNTPVLTTEVFYGIGGTNRGGNTAALSTTLAKVTQTVAGANVGTYPSACTVTLVPGTHGTDAVNLYGAWVEYTRTELADLTANANNQVNFQIIARNTSVSY